MKKIFCALILVIGLVSCSYCAEKAMRVTQPAYENMSFYVYRPADTKLPNDVYATYDDYLVYKNSKNVWCYASFENNSAVKTNYIVGSVVPSVVNITPYKQETSSVAPVLNTDRTPAPIPKLTIISRSVRPQVVELPDKPAVPEAISLHSDPGNTNGIPVGPAIPRQVTVPGKSSTATTPGTIPSQQIVAQERISVPENFSVQSTPPNPQVQAVPKQVTAPQVLSTEPVPKYARIVYMPPSSGLESNNSTYIYSGNVTDDWTQNPNFMAVSRWQNSIDRIGVLDNPAIPVAWKGDYPEVIYAWTGLQWQQVVPRGERAKAANTLRRNIYDLTLSTNRTNLLRWTNEDTHVLSQYAMMWGYEWLGQIILGRTY